jgi:putative RNA 2'-phosphotransferase
MDHKKISKFLSLVLRHDSAKIGIDLDHQGWTDCADLIEASNRNGVPLDAALLEEIVRSSDKQRFALSDDKTRIRANQGHSVSVDLQLEKLTPPKTLFHGTVEKFLPSIQTRGLEKSERHHVHLSADIETATKVGERRGKPVILLVDAGRMHKAGYHFHRSENGVWLVDHIPVEFIRFDVKTTVLYRPVGPEELALIEASGCSAFPPRLPEQPIFYPVTNEPYAI